MKLIGFQNHPSTREPAAVVDLSRGFRPPLPAAAFSGQMLRAGVSNFNDTTKEQQQTSGTLVFTLSSCMSFVAQRCVCPGTASKWSSWKAHLTGGP